MMATIGQAVELIANPGFVSNKESLGISNFRLPFAIITYWRSVDAHERSHANDSFKKKCAKLATMRSETKELGKV